MSYLKSCGYPCRTREDLVEFTFSVKAGRSCGGIAAISSLASILNIVIILYSSQGARRIDAMKSQVGPKVVIHVYENSHMSPPVYESVVKIIHAIPSSSNDENTSSQPMRFTKELTEKILPSLSEALLIQVPVDIVNGLKFVSFNVNGCRTARKQAAIDDYLTSCLVHVALLQEVNLSATQLITQHYIWHMGYTALNRKRGLAILINRGTAVKIRRSNHCGPYIQFMEITYQVIIYLLI